MWLAAAAALALLAAPPSAFISAANISYVPVADPGNPDDTHGDGYGGVDETFWIGTYEVTTGQYAEFLNAVAADDPHGLYNDRMWSDPFGCKIRRDGSPGGYTYVVEDPQRIDRPVNYVGFYDALRFANWLHNDQGDGDTEDGAYTLTQAGIDANTITRNPGAEVWIPSEDEWYKSAYYDAASGTYLDYPTAGNVAPGNDTSNPDAGNNANYWIGGYALGTPLWTTPVGEFENSASAFGTFDQGGNLLEWNDTIVEGDFRGYRGGSFYYLDFAGLPASARFYSDPSLELLNVGFRVATVPEPSTVVLLSVGLLGGLLWRRKR